MLAGAAGGGRRAHMRTRAHASGEGDRYASTEARKAFVDGMLRQSVGIAVTARDAFWANPMNHMLDGAVRCRPLVAGSVGTATETIPFNGITDTSTHLLDADESRGLMARTRAVQQHPAEQGDCIWVSFA